MSRILIIEDELPMRTALADALGSAGFRVLTSEDGEKGLARALEQLPDLILLDVMMPRLDGFALAAELRRLGRTVPILMLTARGGVQDRVRGLDAGADDYLLKPFSTEELLARVRALLRRTQRNESTGTLQLELGRVRIDFVRQEATSGSEALHLTTREFAMLRLMAETPGVPVSRERFLDVVWGVNAFPTTRTVDTHMATLRSKIEPNPEQPVFLQTVHGVGYKLVLPQ
jgi:DNA-binding response OmpR family regulator